MTLKKGSGYMARCKECIHDKVCVHKANIQTDTYAYMGVNYDTEKCEHYKPTADVVPKSEYDRLEKLFNDMTQEAKEYLNRLYGIRADVAREIFEEIDKLLQRDGIFMWRFDIDRYDELKKKYAEGEKE